ncbi:MAG: M20/M25/M40 family metallo-hydrolase, partial [Nakamurella sp.]
GARLKVLGEPNRPPMETSSGEALFHRAVVLGGQLGLAELVQTTVGGGSDGNFTAGIGVPTLDGLGAVGGGAHADDEHIRLDQLVPRTALLVALVQDTLLADGSASNSAAAAPGQPAVAEDLPG